MQILQPTDKIWFNKYTINYFLPFNPDVPDGI